MDFATGGTAGLDGAGFTITAFAGAAFFTAAFTGGFCARAGACFATGFAFAAGGFATPGFFTAFTATFFLATAFVIARRAGAVFFMTLPFFTLVTASLREAVACFTVVTFFTGFLLAPALLLFFGPRTGFGAGRFAAIFFLAMAVLRG